MYKNITDKNDSIFDSLPIGLWIFSPEGFLVDINQKGLEIIGVSDKESIKGIHFLSSPNMAEDIKDAFIKREAICTTVIYDCAKNKDTHYYDSSKDSEIIQARYSGTPIFDSRGEFEKYIIYIEDITELYSKDLMLCKAQRNLSLALEAGGVSVWEYDVNSTCFSPLDSTFVAKDIIKLDERMALVHPDDADELMATFNKVSKGERLNSTISFRVKDIITGKYIYERLDMFPLFSENGNVDRIIGTRRDITEDVLSKQKLDEAILYMKLSTQSTNTIMCYIEEGCFFIFKNNTFVETTTLLSQLNSIHPEDRKRAEYMYNTLLSNSDYSCDREVLRVYDESVDDYKYLECSFKVIKDHKGNVFRIVGGYCDITKQRKADINTENIRKALDLALEASNIIVWIDYLNINKVGNVNRADAIYGAISGFDSDNPFWQESIHPQDIERYKKYHKTVMCGSEKKEPIVISIKNGDRYGYCELRLFALYDDKGEQTCVIEVLKDMDEVTNLNESLTNLYAESQLILQTLPVGIAIYDKNGKQQYINNAMAQAFGVSDIESHIKKAINVFDDPIFTREDLNLLKMGEDLDRIIEYDLQVANDVNFFETKYKHKIYFEGKTRNIKDSNGNIVKYIMIVNDITEKRKYELILKDSERNLRLALEVAGNVDTWTYDIKSEIFYPLGNNCSFGNFPFNLDYFNTLIHPDDMQKRDIIINDLIQNKIDEGKTVLRFKTDIMQDKYNYYEASLIVKKENGVAVAIPCGLKNITDSYLHEIEREYNKKRVDFTIEGAELALWEYDVLKKKFVLHNNAVVGLEPLNGLSIEDYIQTLDIDDDSELNRMISAMDGAQNSTKSIEIRMKPKSVPVGTDEWIHYTSMGTPFERDEYGAVVKYVGYIRNNTKWVRLNKTLFDTNTQLKTVLDIGLIFPFICEVRDDKYHFFSTGIDGEMNAFPIAPNTRFTLDQLLETLCSENAKKLKENFMDLVAGNISQIYTEVKWNSKFKNDSVYELNITAVRNEDLEQSFKIIGYMQDVTERNQMIYDLKEAKIEAEKSVKLKTAFLENMSHEIRTPLNAIIGFSELLSEEEDDETKSEYIGIISTNNDLLLKLITDILDLSKIDAGLIDLKISQFDFSRFFHEMYLSMQQRVVNPNVKLFIINPYSECIVELDKNVLAQICINFITNAIKYTPKGRIEMGYERINGGIRLYVKDTGIGVTAEKQYKLFERFEKLDSFAQGTGLGLSIAKALVESMKGEIGFESQEGVGSTFWAWIPC